MKQRFSITERLVVLATIGILVAMVTPAQGQAIIPEGATIDQATLTVWSDEAYGSMVNLHRITADWGESSVTWFSMQGNYDLTVANYFVAEYGANSVDVTDLVQGWVDGEFPNFGILMEQTSADLSWFHSSETVDVSLRPQLEIWYSSGCGQSRYVLIKRPGDVQDGVKDSFIQEEWINKNKGTSPLILTGFYEGLEKASVVRFDFAVAPGTATYGFWKRHPEAWPVETIEVGGVSYSKAEAIQIMRAWPAGDMTRVMFKTLAAAKLNVLAGNDDSCIFAEIQAADDWLIDYPLGSGVRPWGWNSPWRQIRSEHWMLVMYNLGWLPCADFRH